MISWSYGFPFRSAFTYYSYDKNETDYILAENGYGTVYIKDRFDIREKAFKNDNIRDFFILEEMYSETAEVMLDEKTVNALS